MTQSKKKCEYHRLDEGLAVRKVPQSKNWGLYLKIPGHKAIQHSLKTPDYNEAVRKAWKAYTYAHASIENGETLKTPKQRKTLHQLIDELINEYEVAQSKVKVQGKEGIHATHIRLFKRIKAFYDDEIKPTALNTSALRSYFQTHAPFSVTQLRATRYCFTQIFDRAFEHQMIEKDQIVDLKKIKVEKLKHERRDHFSYYEYAKLSAHGLSQIKHAHGKGKHTQRMTVLYASFLFYSGVRTGSEALGIKWSNLAYNGRGDLYCVIKDGKTKNYKKNNRNVIFDTNAEDCIVQSAREKYPFVKPEHTRREVINHLSRHKPNESVFSTKFGKSPAYERIFKRWVDELKESGVLPKNKTLTLYSLRHSYITRSIEAGVPTPLIAENAGTSASMIEKHYSHITVLTESARQYLLRDKVAIEAEVQAETEPKKDKHEHLLELTQKMIQHTES